MKTLPQDNDVLALLQVCMTLIDDKNTIFIEPTLLRNLKNALTAFTKYTIPTLLRVNTMPVYITCGEKQLIIQNAARRRMLYNVVQRMQSDSASQHRWAPCTDLEKDNIIRDYRQRNQETYSFENTSNITSGNKKPVHVSSKEIDFTYPAILTELFTAVNDVLKHDNALFIDNDLIGETKRRMHEIHAYCSGYESFDISCITDEYDINGTTIRLTESGKKLIFLQAIHMVQNSPTFRLPNVVIDIITEYIITIWDEIPETIGPLTLHVDDDGDILFTCGDGEFFYV